MTVNLPQWTSVFFNAWLLPPGMQLTLLLAGLILWKRRPWIARSCAGLAGLSLYFLSAPYFVELLVHAVEPAPDALQPNTAYRAVICLTGGTNFHAPEYANGVAPADATAMRCNFAAMLAMERHLPLLVSGAGYLNPPESQVVSNYLQRLNVPVTVYTERVSRNTQQAPPAILAAFPDMKGPIILVTDALHMYRAKPWFEHYGFVVTAIPTRYSNVEPLSLASFMPNMGAFKDTQAALHEVVGRIMVPARE